MTDPAIQFDGPDDSHRQSAPKSAARLEDIWGTIRQVSSPPTWTPRGRFEESVALYSSSNSRTLYIYDKTSKAWVAFKSGSYGGRVAADGTAISLPTGWSSAKTGTGQYTVTHNLGHTVYAVALTSLDNNLSTVNLKAINNNTFTLITWNNTPTNTDLPFSFVLSVI